MRPLTVFKWLFRSRMTKTFIIICIVFSPSLLFLNNEPETYPISGTIQKMVKKYKSSLEDIRNERCPHTLKQSKPISPLAPLNQHFLNADPPLTKKQINEYLELGCGLKEYETAFGNKSWRENGFVYLPGQSGHRKLADVYSADYVPYIPYNHTLFFEGRNHDTVPMSGRKIILSRLAGMDEVKTPVPMSACPEFPCLHTTDWNTYVMNSSALTVNVEHMRGPPPPNRRADQIYIFYIYEPLEPRWTSRPSLHNKKYKWKSAFNWTMSYHLDSDIYMPYGVIRRRPTPVSKNYNSIIAQKQKMAAWFVSHCPTFSRREDYVKELQRYISVDIFGSCGNHQCPRDKDIECLTNVSRTYKFYFAFENGICDDYTSEKFFKSLKMDAVVVARGSNSYFKTVPRGIYIDTADFDSPKDLAKYLQYLDRNDEEYLKILEKKDQFFVSYQDYPHSVEGTVWIKYNWERVPMCEICQRLWNIDKYAKTYPDMEEWFNDRLCREPTDLDPPVKAKRVETMG